MVDTVKLLDGTQVFPSERLKAKQQMAEMEEDLKVAIEMDKIEKEKKAIEYEKKTEEEKEQAYSRENRR